SRSCLLITPDENSPFALSSWTFANCRFATLEARCDSQLETVAACRRGSISISDWPFFTCSPDFTLMATIQPSTSDMIVAELRDLMVATYSELLPISYDPMRWTFTGMVGGPCGPSAVLRLQAASSIVNPTRRSINRTLAGLILPRWWFGKRSR